MISDDNTYFGLNHFDRDGKAVMVDVTDKAVTRREAVASGEIRVSPAVFRAVCEGTAEKGDVLGTARIAGIMAACRLPVSLSIFSRMKKPSRYAHAALPESRGVPELRWKR